jgi:ribonuclease P protein component
MILYISKEMPDFKIIDKKMKALLTKFNDQVSNIEKNEKDI